MFNIYFQTKNTLFFFPLLITSFACLWCNLFEVSSIIQLMGSGISHIIIKSLHTSKEHVKSNSCEVQLLEVAISISSTES